MIRQLLALTSAVVCSACATSLPIAEVIASAQTTPVESTDDAADDVALWLNRADPQRSLVLGTDKQRGLDVYSLDGRRLQSLPIGRLNNVDIRQNVGIGAWTGDLVTASNRSNNSVSLFVMDNGIVRSIGSIALPGGEEPYGICQATLKDQALVVVTYKSGALAIYRLLDLEPVVSRLVADWRFDSQIEGCVVDDESGQLFVGEEEHGIWQLAISWQGNQLTLDEPRLVASVGRGTPLIADVEGLAIYSGERESDRFLVASSQGSNGYTVYDLVAPWRYRGRFRVVANGAIDGTEETDGIEISASPLGPQYPKGLFVAQDGRRPGHQTQNFKLVDWRRISLSLGL